MMEEKCKCVLSVVFPGIILLVNFGTVKLFHEKLTILFNIFTESAPRGVTLMSPYV